MEQQTNLFDLRIDAEAEKFLRETARWGRLLSIVGFVFCAILIIFAVFISSNFGAMTVPFLNIAQSGDFGPVLISAIWILSALFLFLPCLYLFNFSAKMKKALTLQDQSALNISLKNLKSCFRFYGVLTLCMVGLYALLFIIGLLFAALS
jgi:hypothetical protein